MLTQFLAEIYSQGARQCLGVGTKHLSWPTGHVSALNWTFLSLFPLVSMLGVAAVTAVILSEKIVTVSGIK